MQDYFGYILKSVVILHRKIENRTDLVNHLKQDRNEKD